MFELCLTAVIWGFSFALAKMSLNVFDPFELVTLRLALGALTVFAITRFFQTPGLEKTLPSSRSFNWTALGIGLFEFAGTYIFYTWALTKLPSGVVGTLTLLTPIFTYLVSLAFGVSPLSPRFFAAIALSVTGAALCFPLSTLFSFSSFSVSSVGVGFFLIMTSNAFFAVGNVLITRADRDQSWRQEITYQGLAYGAFFSFIVFLFTPHQSFDRLMTLRVWFLPLYLGIVATGLGFYLWNRGVQKVTATRASIIGNFKAPFSLLWGAILLREPLSFRIFAGLLLLICATQLLPKAEPLNRRP